jgi:hypothetical protein
VQDEQTDVKARDREIGAQDGQTDVQVRDRENGVQNGQIDTQTTTVTQRQEQQEQQNAQFEDRITNQELQLATEPFEDADSPKQVQNHKNKTGKNATKVQTRYGTNPVLVSPRTHGKSTRTRQGTTENRLDEGMASGLEEDEDTEQRTDKKHNTLEEHKLAMTEMLATALRFANNISQNIGQIRRERRSMESKQTNCYRNGSTHHLMKDPTETHTGQQGTRGCKGYNSTPFQRDYPHNMSRGNRGGRGNSRARGNNRGTQPDQRFRPTQYYHRDGVQPQGYYEGDSYRGGGHKGNIPERDNYGEPRGGCGRGAQQRGKILECWTCGGPHYQNMCEYL